MPHFVPQHIGKYVFSICLLLLLGANQALAQIQPDTTSTPKLPSIVQPPDSVSNDSMAVDSSGYMDPSAFSQGFQPPPPNGEQNGAQNGGTVPDAVEFQSNDSLIVDFRKGRTATLYGNAKVNHTAGALASGEIEMDLETSQVEATSSSAAEDTLSMPVLTRDGEEIRSRRILFNYKTQKGKFEEARINVGEGQLIGSKVKNVNETEVFIENGIYSTCEPEYLYYYIKAQKMKVVDQDEIFFTNARSSIILAAIHWCKKAT